MTIKYDWHYNSRIHPIYGAAVPWNYCMHSDGFQIYSGGISNGITFDHTILGPGFLQGTILGQSGTLTAQVNNAHFSNVLVMGDFNAGLMGYAATLPTGWVIDHTTIYMARSPSWHLSQSYPGTGTNESLIIDGSNHQLTNSLIYDGRVFNSGFTYANNCEWSPYGNNTLEAGTVNGLRVDPQLVRPPPLTVPDATLGLTGATPTSPTMQDFINADYTIGGGACLGKGSSLTSVAQLLAS